MDAFGRYALIRRLGAGGMGEVFLARDTTTNQEVVVKRVLPHLTENPRFLRLFLDETRIASRLVHANIASMLDLGEVGGVWFVAMEYIPGKDLRELLKRCRESGALVPTEVVCAIGIAVAHGLAYAHRATDAQGRSLNIVHRDVSPHNVIIGRDGRISLIDFGVAKATNRSVHTASGVLKGKFPYMSPEQAQAKPVDARTDVYALGIVLWEALCGRYLFRGKSDAATLKLVRDGLVPPPSSLRPNVPPDLERVMLKALRREPGERYQTADALAEALENVAAALPPADVVGWLKEHDDVPGFDDEADSEAFVEAFSDDADLTLVGDDEPELPKGEPTVASSPRRRPTREPPSQPSLPTVTPPPPARRGTNLVPQPTSFVGRVAELADLHQLFHQGARLITLLGPGGTGKTRLAHQLASQLVTHYQSAKGVPRGGVWFCDLTEATDLESICASVARALGVPLAPGNPVRPLGHALAARGETLVVLDNFEQVVALAPETIGVWLKVAPKTRFVVSSRELLRVDHEHVFEVPPLHLPAGDEPLRTSEAVQLFLERARLARPGWEPTDDDVAAIGTLVRSLDGLPLAIELAAGRSGTLTPAQLVKRLPKRFELLVTKGGVDRQATLRGAIDWSWDNLSPEEASSLAQLSVFRGGFTAEACEAVLRLPAGLEPLTVLMQLRSKSLVRVSFPNGNERQSRFGLFETIREYAAEKLDTMPERATVFDRHLAYYLTLGKQLATGAEGNKAQLDELDLERENLVAVVQRALANKQPVRALEALMALDPLLTIRGPASVQLQLLNEAVDALPPNEHRTLALEARARARINRGRALDSEEDVQEALALAQRFGQRAVEARLEYLAGITAHLRGQRRDSSQFFDHAIEHLTEQGDELTRGRALSAFAGLNAELGFESRALEMYGQALEIHRAVGDRRYEGVTLASLGVQQQSLGLLREARANYQAALAIHRALGNRRAEGITRLNLGDLCADLEQSGRAFGHYQAALEIVREVGARRFEGIVLFALGSLHLQYGEYEDAELRITEAIEIEQEVGDDRYLGLSLAVRAASVALLGNANQAETQIAEASRLLNEVGDAKFLDALDLYRGHLELAHSTETRSPSQAAVLRERVERRISQAERPGPPDEEHPSGTPSPADRSEHVRAALRSLRGALADVDAALKPA